VTAAERQRAAWVVVQCVAAIWALAVMMDAVGGR
jgi:hypothetical protein